MNRRAMRATAALAAAAIALGGCLPILRITSRTRILPDGTTTRETRIVKERRDANDDEEKRLNERPIAEDFARSLGEGFPTTERTADEIRMTGVFAHPSHVPSDFQRSVDAVDGTAANRVTYLTIDVLFGTQCLYRERYMDAIPPEDLAESKRAAVDFATSFVRAMVEHEFGDVFDRSEFDRWTRTDLADALGDFIEMYWESRPALAHPVESVRDATLKQVVDRVEKRLKKLGLEVDLDAEHEAIERAMQGFVLKLLATKLKPAKGKSRALAIEDFLYLFPAGDPREGVRIAFERAVEREYGSKEDLKREFDRVLIGITGTFGSPPAEGEFRFDCAVEMPGMLLRSNGYIESEQSAFWVFDGAALFPQGQLLEAESFLPDHGMLGRIRELKVTLDKRDAVRLIRALADVPAEARAELRAALETCARHGTLDVLAASSDPESEKMLKRLAPVLEVMRKDA